MADVRVDTFSKENKRLVLVPSFCVGSQDLGDVEGIQKIYFDEVVAWDNSVGVRFPYNTAIDDTTDVTQTNHLKVTVHEGSATQLVDPDLVALFFAKGWTTLSRGRGVCCAVLFLWANEDVYPNGIPHVNALIRGQRCFDPRTSTTIYTTNPAIIIRDFLTSPLYGFNVATADLVDQTFIDMANHCDDLVSKPGGGTQKRFEANGWVDTSRTLTSNLADLATSCRAQVFETGGKWHIHIRRALAVSGLKIDKDNTVEGSWKFFLPGSRDVPNVMRATYIDPGQDYRPDTVQWPEPGAANAALINDNNFESRFAVDLPYTDNRVRAQQTVLTLIKELREGIMVTLTAKESMLRGIIGDLVELTHITPGWTNKPFWIIAMSVRPDLNNDMVLVEYEPTVYNLDAQVDQPIIPDTDLPDSFAVAAPASLTLAATTAEALTTGDGTYIARIKATWPAADTPFIVEYEVEAKRDSEESVYDSWGSTPATEREFFIWPVTEGDLWSVRVRAVNRIGKVSAWVEQTTIPQFGDGSTSKNITDGFSATQNAAAPENGTVVVQDEHLDVTHVDVHTDTHTDQHCDFNDTFHCDCSAGAGGHSDEVGPCHSDLHNDVPHIDSHNDVTHSDVAGDDAFSNLEDANGISTSFGCWFDVDGTSMPGGINAFLDFFVNDGPGSINWTLTKSAGPFTNATNLTDQSVAFTAAMAADWDIMVTPRYSAPVASGAECVFTLHGEDHGTQAGVQYVLRGATHQPSRFILPVGTDLWAT